MADPGVPPQLVCEYLACVVSGIQSFEPEVRVFCLSAPLETIRQRLRLRGASLDGPEGAWILKRAEYSVRAHEDPQFGERIETAQRSIAEVAGHILGELTRDVSPRTTTHPPRLDR